MSRKKDALPRGVRWRFGKYEARAGTHRFGCFLTVEEAADAARVGRQSLGIDDSNLRTGDPMSAIRIEGDVAYVTLTRGAISVIDASDVSIAAKQFWSFNRRYATGGRGNLLHCEIMRPSEDLEVDHINGDKLDNRRANLRVVTHAQNMQNMRRRNQDMPRGVSLRRKTQTYQAYVNLKGKRYHIGTFNTIEEADAAARAGRAALYTHANEDRHAPLVEAGQLPMWGRQAPLADMSDEQLAAEGARLQSQHDALRRQAEAIAAEVVRRKANRGDAAEAK